MTNMIRRIAPLCALLTIAHPALTAPANAKDDPKVRARVAIEFPIPEMSAGNAPVDKHEDTLVLESGGKLTYNGEAVSRSKAKKIASQPRPGETSKIAVSVPGGTSAIDAAKLLSIFPEMGVFKVSGLDGFRTFEHATDSDGQGIAAAPFQGDYGKFDVPLVVGFAKGRDQCIVALNGRTMGSEEFYDRSFEWLDRLVQNAGGVEAILYETDQGRDIVARLQTSPDTPWRCISGALYGLQVSGWPVVDVSVIEPD